MFTDMQQWADIRRRVLVEGVSKRQILRETGMHWRALEKVLANPEPPGYRIKVPRPRPKLGPFLDRIRDVDISVSRSMADGILGRRKLFGGHHRTPL